MSLAENLLNSLDETAYSSVSVPNVVEEEHIIIDNARIMTVPSSLKTIAVTGDKDIETVTFDCIRYWDGHDLSTFAIYLNYVLPDMTSGTYIPESIVAEDDVFHFDWKIKNNITQKSGKISFAITAIKTKQNENGETVVDKQWSSLISTDCSIAVGLDISNIPDNDESADILAQMSAILEKIHADVDEWVKDALVQEDGNSETKAMSQKATTQSIQESKQETIAYTDEKIQETDEHILKNYEVTIMNSKRITNIEKGLPSEQFHTDSSVAYTKVVPEKALPYAEISKVGGMTYYDDTVDMLFSVRVTEIESIGANLLIYPYTDSTISKSGITFTDNGDGSIGVNGTSYDIVYFTIGTSIYLESGSYCISTNIPNVEICALANGQYYWNTNFTLNSDANVEVFIRILSGNSFNNDTIVPMLNKGTIALPATPYAKYILPIPTAVQALDGYGYGVNENCYNYIDFEKMRFVKRVACVDMGTLDWNKWDAYENGFYAANPIPNLKPGTSNLLTTRYRAEYSEADKTMWTHPSDNVLYVLDSDYSDAERFKADKIGVMLYYELAEPIITDISSIISADNFIKVEGGGTITMVHVSYDKYAVPSEITYMLKEATV